MAERLITIATFNDVTEAHILKGRLEAEGILCFLGDENIVGVQPFYATAVGGVKLKVPETEVMEAKAILARIQEGSTLFDYDSIELAPPMQEQTVEITCPKCGSDNVEQQVFNKTVFSISYLFLGFPVPFLNRKKFVCHECGNTWKTN
ncbi:DUF2007 domain-containing protein [uncultured Pontibacter sp.]|uniref:putative signal transducing protein n=1 Tax=uncultured Pontibacter sp. TaxID=453356 RepID=UPI00261DA26A|nr:DUF2007 domain-containing protein [uncultured Pontibacter sp.]